MANRDSKEDLSHFETSRPDSQSYEVGYRRPPLNTRFKPGRSGNPRGRPRRRPSLPEILGKELYKIIAVRDGDREERMLTLEALTKMAVRAAYKGNTRLLTLLLKIPGTALSDAWRNPPGDIHPGMTVSEAAEMYERTLKYE